MVSKRYAKANNKHVADYDENKPGKYIMYLDANNLYGWAMSQPLPVSNFKWVDNIDELQIMNHDSEKRYILEIDLEYPQELHESHNAYPLAPERLVVQKE